MSKGFIVLEDGKAFEGEIVVGDLAVGEAVFNTSLTGYQEILTDPSYAGQIITMTYPHIGNYGVVAGDDESRNIFASGLVVREFSKMFSNWRAKEGLRSFLGKRNITAIEGVDTRALTKHIRNHGAMRAAIGSASKHSEKSLQKIALEAEKMEGADLASKVTIPEPYTEGMKESKFHVVALDFGMKRNILRKLVEHNCRVDVLPANATATEILDKNPDGVFLSNGPGDPAPLDYAVDTIKQLLGKVPIFGICLGHQLLSLAFSLKTFKLKFGHRGANHPVKNLKTGKVEITSQNHGFAVDGSQFTVHGQQSVGSLSLRAKRGNLTQHSTRNSQPSVKVELTHINLNDNTVEGIRCPEFSAFSVQYHPEAAPGPHDSGYLFHEFCELMEEAQKSGGRIA